jgi:hypothetical protein|tara:strand:+ start:164 stop:511 length:348 start_codon:yes stop_codon:yes gene_type:complete
VSNRNVYREILKVDSVLRESLFDRRFITDANILSRWVSPAPTDEELREELDHIERIYTVGDRLYKFAYEYYGDVDYWWVIAWYNNKPTDSHFKIGDVVYIPRELDVALRIATREL